MEKVFLSHSSKDKQYVEYIANKFGKDSCVYDTMCFDAGMKTIDEIFKGLEQTSIFVLFISDASLNSDWVKCEISAAEEHLHHDSSKLSQIFPIIIDESVRHDDPRIPDFIRKGIYSYNLRVILKPTVAYRKIKAQITNRLLQTNLQFQSSYECFYGRDSEIRAFKTRFDASSGLKVLVAAGIPGIGRRSYLVHALRNAKIIEDYYEPVVISLGTLDGIEDLLSKLYEAGFGFYPFDKIIALDSIEAKILALTKALSDVQKFNEHVIIYDEGCLIGHSGEPAYWFEKAVLNDDIRPEITLSLASQYSVSNMYERKHSWVFSTVISALTYPEWSGLLRVYSKRINSEIAQVDREYFKDVITGYPPQVLYCAELVQEKGIDYVKEHTHELISNITGNATRILGIAISEDVREQGYGLLAFISVYGLVPTTIMQRIFAANQNYQELFWTFKSLTICRYIGSANEYVEVNPVIGDYILRNNFNLPSDIHRILNDEIDRFNKMIKEVPNIAEVEDFESIRYYLKENLKEGKNIPTNFMYSTLYLQSIYELYNNEKYSQVIEIVAALKDSGAFKRYDETVQSRIQSYYCRALAREMRDEFYAEVELIRANKWDVQEGLVEYNFLQGFMARNRGNYEKALNFYQSVLNKSPKHRSAMREIVTVYRGLEDYESAYEYAKLNYERDRENSYFIQSYFDTLIHLPKRTEGQVRQMQEMLDTIARINESKPLSAFYEITAMYAAHVENDKERAFALLDEGKKKFPRSFYIARIRFDCCDYFGDVDGMIQAIQDLQDTCGRNRAMQAQVDIRTAILDAYVHKPETVIYARIDSIKGITPDARQRLKNKIHNIHRKSQ